MGDAKKKGGGKTEMELKEKDYQKELEKLHEELVNLQQWVVRKGLKVCVVFEGRDGACKGGTIKAITERVRRFLGIVPLFEKMMVESGIILLTYWLEMSPEEQPRRYSEGWPGERTTALPASARDTLTATAGYSSMRDTVSPAVSSARERIEVREVRSKRERERFIRFPERIYRDDPHWVPPLLIERREFIDPRKNPFFEHAEVALFMAYGADGSERGRIAAIVNDNHVREHREKTGFFGMFECVDDLEAARLLFEAAAGFLRARGMQTMRGPENLCVNDDIGLLVEGFDTPPSIMMPYNHPYYRALVEGCGFTPSMALLAYRGEDRDGKIPERLARGVALVRRRYDHRVRPLDMKRFDEEIRRIHRVYTKAWEENWGAVPMTDREFAHLAKSLKMVIDPDLCLMAEVDGELVGFSVSLPDLNQALIRLRGRLLPFGIFKLLWHKRKIDALRIITMGVVKEHRGKGIDLLFYHETIRCALAKGYKHAEMSWILENNLPMNLVLRNAGAEVAKTYKLYDRAL